MNEFHKILQEMSILHERKSHDYAPTDDPYANYKFAGKMSKLFNNPDDAGFVGRIGEKIYRLANLENQWAKPLNESIEDTELDILVIVSLWMASRREKRAATKTALGKLQEQMREGSWEGFPEYEPTKDVEPERLNQKSEASRGPKQEQRRRE